MVTAKTSIKNLTTGVPWLFFFLIQLIPLLEAAAEPSPDRMIGQMIMLGFRGDGVRDMGDIPQTLDLIREGKIGGVILFDRDTAHPGTGRNVTNPEQIKTLTASLAAAAPLPLFIAVDQEGGRIQRLKPEQGFQAWPSARQMGELSPKEVFTLADRMGRDLADLGLNLNFAPVLDLDRNPESPAIGALGRSFSPDPGTAASRGLAFMRGLNNAGVIACFKHFPGHGSARADTHQGAADISASWDVTELEPYRRILGQPGAYAVMAAHVFHGGLDPRHPASLSEKIIAKTLRGELGWGGVVFSDDLQMRAIADHYSLREALRLGVMAGVDIFILGNNLPYAPRLGEQAWQTLWELYCQGEIPLERLEASFQRIMRLKAVLVSQAAAPLLPGWPEKFYAGKRTYTEGQTADNR